MQARHWLLGALALGATLVAAAAAPPAMVRVSDPGRQTLAPEIAVGPKGEIALVWLDKSPDKPTTAPAAAQDHAGMQHGPGAAPDMHLSSMDMYFARSTDGGKSFSKPVRVNPEPGHVWGFAVSKPKIAIGRSGTIHIAYPANGASPIEGKSVLLMFYTRSTDGGRTFEAPRLMHAVPKLDQSEFMDGGFTTAHAFGTIGVAPDGGVHAIWVDTREWQRSPGASAAYYSRSTDDGRTWAPENSAMAVDVCPCCQITMAFDAASNVYIGARQVTNNGQRNSTIGLMPAGSNKVTRRTRLARVPWEIEGCPLKPTVMAVSGSTVYAAAFHGGELKAGVYMAVSTDGGATFGEEFALHPEASIADAPAITLARGALPVLAWHGKTTGGRRVFWRTVEGAGRLGAVQELAAPEGVSQAPALATRKDGRVQIVWQQAEQIFTTALDPRATLRAAR